MIFHKKIKDFFIYIKKHILNHQYIILKLILLDNNMNFKINYENFDPSNYSEEVRNSYAFPAQELVYKHIRGEDYMPKK